MGYNTLALLLNDHMHSLRESPKSVLQALTYPPHSDDKREIDMWKKHVIETAHENKEQVPLSGVEVLPTFHADDLHFVLAGRNSLERLTVLRHHYIRASDGKGPQGKPVGPKIPVVTLYLPDWWGQR